MPWQEVAAPSRVVAVVVAEAAFRVVEGLARLEVVVQALVPLEGAVGVPTAAEGCLRPGHPPREPVGAGPPRSCTFGSSH